MNTPLMLLHGWGFSSTVWKPLLQALHARGLHQAYALDLPGFGAAFHEPAPSLDTLLEQLLEQLPARAVLCGWSLGGMLAVQLALRAPERVAAVITLGSNLHFTAQGDWPGMPAEDYQQFCERFALQPEKTWRRFLQLQTQGDSDATVTSRRLQALADFSQLEPDTAAKMLDLLGQIDNRAGFPGLAMPGLHLFGEADAITPVGVAAALAELNPSQQALLLARAGHALPVSHPEELAAHWLDFLREEQLC